MSSCLHRADRAPKPPNGTATVSRTNAPPPTPPALTPSSPAAHPASSEPTLPRPLPGTRVGTVRAIGAGSRFVLLETVSPGIVPGIADGQELRCIHSNAADANGPFASVRVSRERRPPFIVADVLSGQPQAGDDVYAVKSGGAAPLPVPVATPSAASFIPAAALPPAAPAADPALR